MRHREPALKPTTKSLFSTQVMIARISSTKRTWLISSGGVRQAMNASKDKSLIICSLEIGVRLRPAALMWTQRPSALNHNKICRRTLIRRWTLKNKRHRTSGRLIDTWSSWRMLANLSTLCKFSSLCKSSCRVGEIYELSPVFATLYAIVSKL
jgi:hypothetical protein